MDALKKWNAKEHTKKTFAQFKKHMREEHHALKQVGALTIKDSSFYHANIIQQVLTQQTEMQDNLQTAIVQQVKDSLLNALTEYLATQEPSHEEVIKNVSTKAKDATTETILDMMIKLSNKVEELSAAKISSDINPRTGKKYKRYCWSCGCCPHWGKDCKHKKPVHQDNANFKNRMGGSNKNCLPVRE